jgi:prophage tail gpP-like protein
MSAPLSGRAELFVGDTIHAGWTSVSVNRSIEQVANDFSLEITERWPGEETKRPIRPGDKCTLKLDGETVIAGYVDDIDIQYDAGSHTFGVRGRDATGDLVDCAAIHKSGQWKNATLERIARDLCAPFGVKVIVETPVGKPFASFALEEGESAFDAIDRAARERAVLLMADGRGGLLITHASKQATGIRLEEGRNILSASVAASWKDRYSVITVKAQERGSDGFAGAQAAGPSARVTDTMISRYRPLIVLPDSHGSGVSLSTRAAWERAVRIGRSIRVEVTVQGWRDPDGALWRPNTRVTVKSPLLYLDATLLVSAVTYTLDASGTRATLSLAAPSAFDLLPEAGKKKGGGDDALFRHLYE